MRKLYDNFDDVESHAPDDLIDLVEEVKMEFLDPEGSKPSEYLIDAYALMLNFLSKKFNKEKLLEHQYKSDSKILSLIRDFPREYQPEEHLETVNSLLHVIHMGYPELKKLAIEPAIKYMRTKWY